VCPQSVRANLWNTCQVGLFAFRDPFGIRPLVLGHRSSEDGPEWCFASEDCAFGPLGFTKVRLPYETFLPFLA
jgi:glutamine phosphoribosylpyrophosphate amidotransferase